MTQYQEMSESREVYSKQAFNSYMNLPQALTITTSY